MEDLHDIRGPIPLFSLWEEYGIYLLLLVLIVSGYFLFRYFWRKKRDGNLDTVLGVMPSVAPYEEAMGRLIRARALMRPGLDRELSIELSDAIRAYLEAEYHLPAPEKTTEEFLGELKDSSVIRGRAIDVLAVFLERCDAAKFAQKSFSEQDQEALYGKAATFLELVHKEDAVTEKGVVN